MIRHELSSVNFEDSLILHIDDSWSDDCFIGLRGWILSKHGDIGEVNISVGETSVQITSWHPRPDVISAYPQYNQNENCGFVVQVRRFAEHRLTFTAETQGMTASKTLVVQGTPPQPPSNVSQGGGIFDEFVQLVNDRHLRVLEIGSRVVSPGSTSKRGLFPRAASYTGFDYYDDDNTDVVGDAHKLSQYLGGQRFDAVFSISVFEHLAMPWLAAMEINKCLELGGITFHGTHFAWPLHEQPWDFWRFSDEGLKVLFSPPLGFETINVGLYEPLRMHVDSIRPGLELFPKFAGFGGVSILAKKFGDFDHNRFVWDVTMEEALGSESLYPKKES